jgi:AmiR/NasT family two-component response regulator
MAPLAESEQLTELRARIEELEAENENLRIGLASRIILEQAKGVLIERLDLPAEAVFELLRSAARRSRMKIHDLAAEILKSRVTPEYIEREIRHLLGGQGSTVRTRSR